jgi:transposase-like protein
MEPKRPFSSLNWDTTSELVKRYIEHLEKTHVMLVDKVESVEKRIEQLES